MTRQALQRAKQIETEIAILKDRLEHIADAGMVTIGRVVRQGAYGHMVFRQCETHDVAIIDGKQLTEAEQAMLKPNVETIKGRYQAAEQKLAAEYRNRLLQLTKDQISMLEEELADL
jgi:hypothetical protein